VETGQARRAELTELVELYGAPVHAYFRRRVGSAADASDLTQEVFLRLLARTSDARIENVQGYLFMIAANLLAERARRARVRPATSPGELRLEGGAAGEEFSPERILLGKEAYQRLIAALQELPERTRTVFILSRYEELKAPEIARRLGISVSAIEKHLMRAIRHLRERCA